MNQRIGHISFTNPTIKIILPRWELSTAPRASTYRLYDGQDWVAIKVRLLHACEDIMSGKGVVGKVDGKFICTLCHDEAPDAAVLIWKLNQQGL